jgi:hypothetical protein
MRKTGKTSNVQRRTPNAERRLARLIAKELFTSGDGVRATRLVFETKNGSIEGSGWGERPVADVIERALTKQSRRARR